MGGYSGEHDISIASGQQVYEALDKDRYRIYRIIIDRKGWYGLDNEGRRLAVDRGDFSLMLADGSRVHFDLAFIIVHGHPGENGVLQGYFDLLGIAYTTCGFYTSSLTFHKGYCNRVVASFGIVKTAKSVLLYHMPDSPTQGALAQLHYPLFVKPAAGGSSVATTKVKNANELLSAIALAFEQDEQVLVEEGISGREFDCGVFFDGNQKHVFPITEIIPLNGHEFFDYAAKYQGFSNEVCPAECDEAIASHIQEVSAQLYDLLGCRGIVRFDYIYDTATNELYFLEVNTIPGQSSESIVPKQARAMGIDTTQLYQMAIDAAMPD